MGVIIVGVNIAGFRTVFKEGQPELQVDEAWLFNQTLDLRPPKDQCWLSMGERVERQCRFYWEESRMGFGQSLRQTCQADEYRLSAPRPPHALKGQRQLPVKKALRGHLPPTTQNRGCQKGVEKSRVNQPEQPWQLLP